MTRFLTSLLTCLTVSLPAHAVPIQWSSAAGGNDHWYEVVRSPYLNWTDASADANARTHQGLGGHLATVTSQGENDFIAVLTNNEWAWLGGLRSDANGNIAWATGPEAGTIFYGPDAVAGAYENFHVAEPTGLAEDGVHMWSLGTWNDLSTVAALSFVVEYSQPAPVPLPATALFLFSALGGLLVVRRRRLGF